MSLLQSVVVRSGPARASWNGMCAVISYHVRDARMITMDASCSCRSESKVTRCSKVDLKEVASGPAWLTSGLRANQYSMQLRIESLRFTFTVTERAQVDLWFIDRSSSIPRLRAARIRIWPMRSRFTTGNVRANRTIDICLSPDLRHRHHQAVKSPRVAVTK